MNHKVSLTLKLLTEGPDGLDYRVVFHNESDAKLLLPFPEIHRLQFRDTDTMQECEIYHSRLRMSVWRRTDSSPMRKRGHDLRPRLRVGLLTYRAAPGIDG